MATQVSLRSHGYASCNDDATRHKALVTAITAHGKESVRDRLNYVTKLCTEMSSGNCENMQKDVEWLDASFGTKSLDIVKLSKYGYCTKMDVMARHKALQSAIEAVGKDKVVDRLTQVIPLVSNNKKTILENDMFLLKSHVGDTFQIVQSLVCVRDTISKLIKTLS
jgi:hypothetical protein